MTNRNSSQENDGGNTDIPGINSNKSDHVEDDIEIKIKIFSEKLNQFIEELRESEDEVYSQVPSASDHKSLIEKVEGLIDETEDESEIIKQLKEENLELKQKISELEDTIEEIKEVKPTIPIDSSELARYVSIQAEIPLDPLAELQDITILNHFNPKHWDDIIDLNEKHPLTMKLLDVMLEMKEVHLIIVALKLEVEHSQCFDIIQELEKFGVVELEQKMAGGLNPLIRLLGYI
ncbi:MAG: hypothetical protein ACW99Q_11835 [Candidatus Kariarchaeaceae archaeon]|jgi:cell division septum initiation protein DivIVA